MKTKERIEMPVGLNQWHMRHTCSRHMEVRKGQDNSVYVTAYTYRHRNTCVFCFTCSPGKVNGDLYQVHLPPPM